VIAEQNSVELCLDEIDRCRPYFLGILGHRYGSVPSPSELRANMGDASPHEWVLQHEGSSITALEIAYAVFREPTTRKRSFFYLRSPQWLAGLPPELLPMFVEQDSERARRLASQKEALQHLNLGALREYECAFDGFRLRPEIARTLAKTPLPATTETVKASSISPAAFSSLDEGVRAEIARAEHVLVKGLQKPLDGKPSFCEMVYTDLREAILTDLPRPSPPSGDEFEQETQAMADYIENRSSSFVPGANWKSFKDLDQVVEANTGAYLCVTGEAGIGKSAFLSYCCRNWAARSGMITISHFVGVTLRSTNTHWILKRLCRAVVVGAGLSFDIPEGFSDLRRTLPTLFALAAPQRLLIVLDGREQLDAPAGSASLNWLPDELPDGVHVILTAPPDAQVMPLIRRLTHLRQPFEVRPLSGTEAGIIADRFLERYRKRLEPEQRRCVVSQTMSANPLYLHTSLEEIRTLSDRGELERRIAQLPASLEALFDSILDRLEVEYGQSVVSCYVGYLCASRYGLTQAEIRAVIAPEDPDEQWPALQRMLRPYLIDRGGLIDFFHRQLREAAARRYRKERSQEARHRALGALHAAEYRRLGPATSERAFSELTYL
jgi:hypothetical protein